MNNKPLCGASILDVLPHVPDDVVDCHDLVTMNGFDYNNVNVKMYKQILNQYLRLAR